MKIVINSCYGGFGISEAFLKHYNIPYEVDDFGFMHYKEEIDRTDKRLIEYIETYGSKAASGEFAHLEVEKIPAGTAYRINEYDGYEYIEYRDEIEWQIAED